MNKFILVIFLIAVVCLCYEKKNEILSFKDALIGKAQTLTGQKTSEMTLEEALASGKPVIAKLGATWCPPCRKMAPIIKELKKEMAGNAIVLDIDVDQNPDIAKTYNARLIPLTLFFNSKGQLMTKGIGFMTKEQIMDKFNSANE
jgi:thioredoxin 1